MSKQLFSFGLGVAATNRNGEHLEVFYAKPLLNPADGVLTALSNALDYQAGNQVVILNTQQLNALETALREQQIADQADIVKAFKSSEQLVLATILETDDEPKTVAEAYLKLHLLSHRLVKPHGTNLNGMFGVLPNVAWTNEGAIDLQELPERMLDAKLRGKNIEVFSVDKFPKMLNYVVPAGVRVGDAARIRLGAYLGEGTTVMHEGFVNFNAGTAGPGMIEGRISAGVYVEAGSDLGGGCSTMGTLSGGNNVIISIGKECLIGANAGVGIPLGDRCTIEAGLYVTAGSVVHVLDDQGALAEKVKARDLAGKSDLLFRRNSVTGAIEVLTNKSAIELNEALHAHN